MPGADERPQQALVILALVRSVRRGVPPLSTLRSLVHSRMFISSTPLISRKRRRPEFARWRQREKLEHWYAQLEQLKLSAARDRVPDRIMSGVSLAWPEG